MVIRNSFFLFFLAILFLLLYLIWPLLTGFIRELGLTLQEKMVFAEWVLGDEMGFCGSCQSWEIVVCSWRLSSPSQHHYSPLDDCFHFPFHHPMLCTWQGGGGEKHGKCQSAAGNPGNLIDLCRRCAPKVDGRDRRRCVRQGLCSWRDAFLVGWSHGCQGRQAMLLPTVVSSLAMQNLLCPSTAPKGQESPWIKVWGQELRMEEKKSHGGAKKVDSWHGGVQIKPKRKGNWHFFF